MKPNKSALLLGIALAAGLLPDQPARAQQPGTTVVVAKPSPDMAAAARVLRQLDAATAISEGRGARVLTIFFDPNCPYCRQLDADLRPFVGKDGLQLRWVPVAILAPSSLGQAAAILQAKDRLRAFRATEDHGLDPNRPAPTQPSAGQISAQTRRALKANDTVLRRAGIYSSVPLAVFRDREGQPQLLLGVPHGDKALAELLQTVGP